MAKKPAPPRTLTQRAENELGNAPPMTIELAVVFAKLLHIGCPAPRAVLYCAPQLATGGPGMIDVVKTVARQWVHDVLVVEAIGNINGGAFHELPAEDRMRIALEKSTAEISFYLFATNFNDVDSREGIDKIKYAREVLKVALGQQPDELDPMQAFARYALDMAREAQAKRSAGKKTPPQLSPEPNFKM